MSVTIIERLVNIGEALTSSTDKIYRAMAGKKASDDTAIPLSADNFGAMQTCYNPKSGLTDNFGRARISSPFSIWLANQIDAANNFKYDDILTGAATTTYLANDSSVRLRTTTASGDIAVRQSREYIPYIPGQSQQIIISGSLGAAKTNVTKRMGYFDANDGIFIEQTGSDLAVVLRSSASGSPVDTRILQANWSIDTLDGSGPSGITLDLSQFLVIIIDFGWLGGAGARIAIAQNSVLHYFHQFDIASTTVFLKRPNLPLRWEIRNTGTVASNTDLLQTCGSVFAEGGFSPQGIPVSVFNSTARSVSTTPIPIISVRLNSTHARSSIIPKAFSVLTSSNTNFISYVVARGSLTNASFSATSGQTTEFDIAATAITGGTIIETSFGSANTARSAGTLLSEPLRIAANAAGTRDILSLVVQATSGSGDMHGSLTWEELI